MPPFNLTSSVGAFIQALQKQKIALGNVWFRIVSRPGLGVADKAKPIQTKKFAIHTLGHEPTFAACQRNV
jgi:hypothetical protein